MTTKPKGDVALRLSDGAWHEEDLSVEGDVLTEDFVDQTAGFPDRHGRKAFKNLVRTVKTGFPNCRHPVEDVVVDDSAVAVHWRYVETHEGAFLGGTAPGCGRLRLRLLSRPLT